MAVKKKLSEPDIAPIEIHQPSIYNFFQFIHEYAPLMPYLGMEFYATKKNMAQGLLIDMDGVVYGGDLMIPGADVFIKKPGRSEDSFQLYDQQQSTDPGWKRCANCTSLAWT